MRLEEMSAAQKKRTRTTRHATQAQPALLAADAPFVAALEAIPAEDWCRTWEAGRTIMLRRTSKMRAKLPFVLRQLAAMTARCLITTPELPECEMRGQDTVQLAGVLAQCQALAHLDLSGNSNFGARGAERLEGVLAQCAALAHLNHRDNEIGDAGAERLAGVLAQCRALAHFDLSYNEIGNAGAESLAAVLAQCTALTHINLWYNKIGAAGEGRFELRGMVKLLALFWRTIFWTTTTSRIYMTRQIFGSSMTMTRRRRTTRTTSRRRRRRWRRRRRRYSGFTGRGRGACTAS
jgi:hypothetical protein